MSTIPHIEEIMMEEGRSDPNIGHLWRQSLRGSDPSAIDTPSHVIETGSAYLLRCLSRLRNLNFRKSAEDNGLIRGTEVRTLNQCPEGYPSLATLVDSDENFMLYRRFGFLQARLLLYKQDELRQLEEELDEMDLLDSARNLKSRQTADARDKMRKFKMQIIYEKFQEYAELLLMARDIECYIYKREDLITLKPGREHAWLDAFVEKVLKKLTCRYTRYMFSTTDLQAKADVKGVVLYDRVRIDILVSVLNMAIIVVLLVTPVYILWRLTTAKDTATTSSTSKIIGVLSAFTIIFSLVLSFFTRAKRHEILASAAAYCAVLVVFIGNVKQLGP